MVHEHQSEYYQSINRSTQQTDAAPFIEFMLGVIFETVASANANDTPQVSPQVSPQVKALLDRIAEQAGALTRDELQQALALKDRKSFHDRYIKPALEAGLIEMTLPDKPTSRLQRYRLTDKGRKLR